MPLSDTIKTLIRDAWDDGYYQRRQGSMNGTQSELNGVDGIVSTSG